MLNSSFFYEPVFFIFVIKKMLNSSFHTYAEFVIFIFVISKMLNSYFFRIDIQMLILIP